MAVKTVAEILGEDVYEQMLSDGKSALEIREEAKKKRKSELLASGYKPGVKKETTQNNNQNNFTKFVKESNSPIADFFRAGATTTGRIIAGADYVAEKVGLDLVKDSTTAKLDKSLDELEKKKEETSREGLSDERLEELKLLDQESQEAKGVVDNVTAGAKKMYDVVTHPSEWTLQGSIENLIDPINLVSFGAGGVAAKFARTFVGKAAAGGTAGAVEGGITNSAAEYAIAKGLNKSDEEANKIGLQSFGGGVAAGGTFGTFGGIVNAASTHQVQKVETDHSKILENDLIKEDKTPLTDDEITQKLKEAFTTDNRKVEEEFKVEEAGIVRSKYPKQTNWRFVLNNLPVVRATKTKLPAVINELVEVEIIEPEAAKMIENKAVKMITHKDVIHADYQGWAENMSQDIVAAMNAKKVNDMFKAAGLSTNAVNESKVLTQQLISQGADIPTIKNEINKAFIPTKIEKNISLVLNDGKPLENRFAGTRLRDLTENTILLGQKDPQQLQNDLKRAGVQEELSNAVTESYINKDIEVFDDFVAEKLTKDTQQEIKTTKDSLVKRLTEVTQEEQIIDQQIKDMNNEHTKDQSSNREELPLSEETGDNGSSNKGPNDKPTQQKPGGQEEKPAVSKTISENPGSNPGSDSSSTKISNTDKQVERQQTPGADDGTISKPGSDEVVQTENRSYDEYLENEVDYKGEPFIIESYDEARDGMPSTVTIKPKYQKNPNVRLRSTTLINTTPDKLKAWNNNYNLKGKEKVELTKGQRSEVNSKVEDIIKKPVEEVTPEDKEVLRQYTGKGGIEKDSEGMLTEHYTPYEAVDAIHQAIKDIPGFKPKKALEPAVGSGNFVGFRPELEWTTIDIDKTNHEVVKRLYPGGKHYLASFEDYKGKDFDLIVSNVPFVEVRGESSLTNRSDIKALHDYYFVSSLDKVKDNGVIAFVTSKGVMDKLKSNIRKEIVSKADVIGAYRLPSTTFKKNAHTEVISDVIFLQKRPEGVSSRLSADNEAFIKSSKTKDDIAINGYFQKYPTKVLGKMKAGIDKQYGRAAYEVTGKADYSKIKLDYKAYGNKTSLSPAAASKKDTKVPTEDEAFVKWADKNEIDYSSDNSAANFIKTDDGFKILDQVYKMEDLDKSYKVYKDLSGKSLEKIELLDQINRTKKADLVKKYQDKYKSHPLSDRSLTKIFRAADSMESLYEYGALFDKSFNLSDAFKKETKFTNSGKLEVDNNSSLHDRLLYNENSKGEIDLSEAKHLDRSELNKAFKLGYALSSKDRLVNSALYYSGNIYHKRDQALSLKDKVPGELQKQIDKQIDQLTDKLPQRKTINELDIKGNESWLKDNDLKLFDYDIETKWVNLPNDGGQRKQTSIKSSLGSLYDKYLNQESLIKARDGESETSYKRRLREAQDQVRQIQEDLKEKVKKDPKLKEQIEDIYNRKFNFYVSPDYSKLRYLIDDVLQELPKNIQLRDNQINFVIKALVEGKNINAHDVGGGKTMAGIVLGRVLKKKGISKKPLFVVPSKVIKNWDKEIKLLFPKSKIFNLGSLPKNLREKRLFELGNSEADYVLISQEGFKQLKLPLDVERDYASKLLHENLRNDDLKGRAKQLQEKRVKKYLEALAKSNTNKKITIDKLGIDSVFADEARAFKNVGVNSKLVQNKLGKAFTLSYNKKTDTVSLDSAIAYDFRFKTKYISSKNNGNNVFLFDATPTPNKPIELFTMLKHLDDNIFDEYGIKTDRDFAEQFFVFGMKPSKKGGFERGLLGIKNAIALRSIMDRFIDRIPMSEFAKRKLITLPEAETVKEMIEASSESIEAFEHIAERLKDAKDKNERHKIMGIFSNGVVSSVDPRLYNHEDMSYVDLIDPRPDNSKIKRVVKTVADLNKKDKKAGQIIFLDNAGHSSTLLDQNLHHEIKDDLIKKGFKKEQIAIISGKEITDLTGVEKKASGEKAAKMKQDIVDAYNEGKIKVVIGTTKSAGEGMNIQKFTQSIHHIDLPWTPGEIIQRNGRGLRHGNINKKIKVHYYFQEGTFDSLMYSTIMNKRGWNEAIWDAEAKDFIEVVDDESGAMPTEAEILIEMERDPVEKAKMIVQLEHDKLLKEEDAIKEESRYLKQKVDSIQELISLNKKDIKRIEEDRGNPTPTETLRDLKKKASKKNDKGKQYEEKYKKALESFYERRESLRESKIAKNEVYKEQLLKFQDSKKIVDEDVKAINERLISFEEKHFDQHGRIKTALDKDC